jgi:hypothetical protein
MGVGLQLSARNKPAVIVGPRLLSPLQAVCAATALLLNCSVDFLVNELARDRGFSLRCACASKP